MAEAGVALSALLTRLYSRGYDYLAQDAASRALATSFINEANAELELEEHWPFRLTTTTGTAPLEVANVDQILSVIDTDNSNRELHEMTERELTAFGLDATGTPLWFYRDSLSVRVWPLASTALSVRYWSLPTELVNATDETRVPKRYMGVIVDGAVLRAAADRDNRDAADLADRMYQRGLALMRRQLLVAPTHIQRSGLHEDD
jgi:hypothetical protein